MLTPFVEGFGTSEMGRFVSHIFHFPVMPWPDAITSCAPSEELVAGVTGDVWVQKYSQAVQLEVTCLLVLKHPKCRMDIIDERHFFFF